MKLLNKRFLISAASALLLLPVFGQHRNSSVLDLKHSIEDSAIVFPESYEVDTQKLLERWYLKNYTTTDLENTTDYDPGATDAEIRSRLAALPTIIDMPFNSIVKQYIERYTKNGRKQVTALLGLSSYYMPIFEQALEAAGLPLELKYLPVIESALDPNATSKHGAAGLWQFILSAARGYDMEVTSLIDERRDPYISTDRACRFLKDLYNTYGDWSLAIAAYNCGPGTVNKALTRAGGDRSSHDFWSIYYFLPQETRGYVPMFIAANYVMTYYPEHGIAPVLPTKPLITDSVHVTQRVHFNQIAAILDIPVEEIRILNPQFRADIIPASEARPCNLILPSQQTHAYILSEEQIMAYERDKYARRLDADPGGDPGVIAEEIVQTEDPFNPADLAVVESVASEIEYEQSHPQSSEAAQPKRRRTDSSSSTASQAPAASSSKSSTASSSKSTASTSSKSTTSTSSKSSTASSSKSSSSSSSQTASSSKKGGRQESASTSSKSKKGETAQASSKKGKKGETASAQSKKKQETQAKPKNHTVSSGENLTVIAKKHGVSVDDLRKANPKLKGDMLHPGDELKVPSAKKTSSSKKSGSKKN